MTQTTPTTRRYLVTALEWLSHTTVIEAASAEAAVARGDTGQSRRVADFLLAWWNAGTCGAFDLTTLWGLDDSIVADLVAVFALITRCRRYPDTLGYAEHFAGVVASWRPELME